MGFTPSEGKQPDLLPAKEAQKWFHPERTKVVQKVAKKTLSLLGFLLL